MDPALDAGRAVVWVTQVPSRRDPTTKQVEPSVNIGPAGEHGQIRVIMPSGAAFYATADLVRQLRKELAAYNFERGDAVLCLGDPAILAVAGSVLALQHRNYRILKWDRQTKRYNSVEVRL